MRQTKRYLAQTKFKVVGKNEILLNDLKTSPWAPSAVATNYEIIFSHLKYLSFPWSNCKLNRLHTYMISRTLPKTLKPLWANQVDMLIDRWEKCSNSTGTKWRWSTNYVAQSTISACVHCVLSTPHYYFVLYFILNSLLTFIEWTTFSFDPLHIFIQMNWSQYYSYNTFYL